jgi:ubiquinone/menaquinone biosynthesis C-methylase UbiE
LGIEVGVGTGRFSIPFGIYMGIDPSRNMGRMAKTRNISVCQAVGEYLPFCDDEFDFVLIVTVICFMNSVRHVVDEVRRILKIGGQITIGFIDKETPLGQMYESRKNVDKFYKAAHFYSTPEIINQVGRAGFSQIRCYQTIFGLPCDNEMVYQIREGFGEGAFVAMGAIKIGDRI